MRRVRGIRNDVRNVQIAGERNTGVHKTVVQQSCRFSLLSSRSMQQQATPDGFIAERRRQLNLKCSGLLPSASQRGSWR